MKLQKVILASASPARKSLLKKIGLNFQVIASEIEERVLDSNPKVHVLSLSFQKAKSVEMKILNHFDSYTIIGCDTIVIDPYQKMIGKPRNRNHAKKMLQTLAGNYHTVMTGCTIIIQPDRKKYQTVISTSVKFRVLSNDEIEYYLNQEEWKNRAGGYAIQGLGSILIEEIQGDYYNIVGLPVHWVWQTLLTHFGTKILRKEK
jgi:septum formation protein